MKTKASKAPVPLYPQLARIIKEWKLQSKSLTWLFPSKNDKPMNPEGYERRQYKKLLSNNGLPMIRFHDLRHTLASILLSEGMSSHDVQKILLHATYKTTVEIYRHLLPDQLENALENSLNSAFRRKNSRKEQNDSA